MRLNREKMRNRIILLIFFVLLMNGLVFFVIWAKSDHEKSVKKVKEAKSLYLIENPSEIYHISRMERYGKCYEIYEKGVSSFSIEVECKNWAYPGSEWDGN